MPTVMQHYLRRHQTPEKNRSAHTTCDASLRAPVVLMVSGGADSVALLLKAVTSRLNIDDGRGLQRISRERLHVLHVNHHLRGNDSDEDEAFVRQLCDQYGLPCCVEHACFDNLNGVNLEAAARDVRYKAARRYVKELSEKYSTPRNAARIVTAHTSTDRAETFLMNAVKGAGPAGLSSIPRRRNIVVRPLLDLSHEDLVNYLVDQGQSWREDITNQDTSYLRNFVRHNMLPLAREKNQAFEHVMTQTCDILGDEDAFMQQLSATALRTLIRKQDEGLIVLDARKLVSAEVVIARRVIRLAIKQISPDVRLDMRHVESVLALAVQGEGSCTLPENIDARVEFGLLALRTDKVQEEACVGWLKMPGRMPISGNRVLEARVIRLPPNVDALEYIRKQQSNANTTYVDLATLGFVEADHERLAQGSFDIPFEARMARLWVDTPMPGDVICPLGMAGRSKKLSDLLGECKVPTRERSQVPVIRTTAGGSVVWVGGIRLDERFKCCSTSKVLVELSIHSIDEIVD